MEEAVADRPQKPQKRRTGRPKDSKGVPTLLADMRWVYRQPEARDRARHKPIRQWLKENVNAFMTKMAALETAWMEKKKAERKDNPAQPVPQEADEGQEKAFALLEKLLETP